MLPRMPAAAPSTTPRIAALDQVLAEGSVPADGAAEIAAWAQELAASGRRRMGVDPATVPAPWRDVLADAGVPFAPGGQPWTARGVDALPRPRLDPDGTLLLPPLERFRTLTSLPLKAVRLWVHERFGVRLQVATGVRLWLWSNQLAVVNGDDRHRGGFLHGPTRGMRTVLSLDPGQAQVVRW